MSLSRVIAVFTTFLFSNGAAPAMPAQDAACVVGYICVYPKDNFQGIPTRYAVADLVGDFRSGDGTYPFTTIAESRSVRNRIGYAIDIATIDPKVCIRFPCEQYRTLESVASHQDKGVFIEPHNIIRKALCQADVAPRRRSAT